MTTLSGSRVLLSLLVGGMCLGCGENPTSPARQAAAQASSGDGAATVTNAAPNLVLVLTPLSSPSLVNGNSVEGLAPLKVRFGLCRSDDPDTGDALSFKWYWGDPGDPPYAPGKPNVEGQTPGGPCYAEHTYGEGKYTATVTVSDRHLEDQGGNVGALAQRTQTVTINSYAPRNQSLACAITSFSGTYVGCVLSSSGGVAATTLGSPQERLDWTASGSVASGTIDGGAVSPAELVAGSAFRDFKYGSYVLELTCGDGSKAQASVVIPFSRGVRAAGSC